MLIDWIEAAIANAYRELAARISGSTPPVVEAMVEAAALVAVADGPQPGGDAAARREQAEAINAVRQLANLDRLGLNHAVRRFEAAKSELRRDPGHARAVLARLAEAGLPSAEARMVLSVAGGVAAVDGHVSAAERAALDQLSDALGLAPPAAPRPDQALGR